MKQLIALFLIIATGLNLTSAQGLHLNVGDEFEYRISTHSNTTKTKEDNSTSLLENYSMLSFKFKVLEVNDDSYKIICHHTLKNQYDRQIPFGESQWETSICNHKEFHNDKTIEGHFGDLEFRLTVLKNGKLEDLELTKYKINPRYKTQKEDLTRLYTEKLSSYFFEIPDHLEKGQKFTTDETLFHVDSISDNSTFLSYTSNLPIETSETIIRRGHKRVNYTNKGTSSSNVQVTINNKKGLIKELIRGIEIKTSLNNNGQSIKNSTVRCVNICNDPNPFTCQYVNDGEVSKSINNTNTIVRGRIENPGSDRTVTLQWNEREPSAFKVVLIIVPLKDDNSFEIKLHTDKIRLVTLIHQEQSEFYILPGDELFITLDTKAFDESIHASGIGATHVNMCFNRFRFEEKNHCSNRSVDKKLRKMRLTTDPTAYESYALSLLKLKQNYLLSDKQLCSPEVFLALYWSNQCAIASILSDYLGSVNYGREKVDLAPYDIKEQHYRIIDSLIHADNDLMAFYDTYDNFIRNYIFFYLKEQSKESIGRGRIINVNNYYDDSYTNKYNYAHMFFTGKTQESLKYCTVNDAMKSASWEAYELLLNRYINDYPYSQRSKLLQNAHTKAEGLLKLSPAYNFKLKDLKGKTHQLSDYNGKAVYLKFWDLGCGTDGVSEQRLNQLCEELQDSNMVFITIFFNGDNKSTEKLIKENKKKGIFLVANKQTEILLKREYFFNSIPHYILIDTNGNITSAKEVHPYFLLNYKEIIGEALHPPITSTNFKQRSEVMTYISIGLLILLLLAAGIFLLTKKRNSRQLKLANLNQQLHESELKAIRAQMNPHFIHNCLNSIQNLVQKKENEKAHLYISKFATLIRDTLNLSNKQEIPLSQELEMLNNYITLEELRFNIDFKLNIAPEIDIYSIFIPPMLLQPIIENAILHGLAPISGEKTLSLSIYKCEKLICIEIKDNGIGRVASQETQTNGTGKGTSFTNERLQLMSEKTKSFCEMSISDLQDDHQQPCGTKVIIKIEEED